MAASAQQVKELREKTGAPMMDCKRALDEAGGEIDKALVLLRERGIARAGKKQERSAMEGVIGSYIHSNSKLGVLVEVACETDFVARTDEFATLVKELAMQIAAARPRVVRREELPEELVAREKSILASQAQAEGKPQHIVDKIVSGRLERFFSEACLLDQAYMRDQDKNVQELIDETIAKLGEKIEVRRFAFMQVGGGQEE